VPYFLDGEQRWQCDTYPLQPCKPPTAQLHFTGKSHWVMSCQQEEGHNIYIADSILHKNAVTPSLQIQLAQIYGQDIHKLYINMPPVQQQRNGIDCGVFAIANMVEYLITKNDPSTYQYFDQPAMRDHLVKCFENGIFELFPKARSTPKINSRPLEYIRKCISLHCVCRLPEVVDNMAACTNCSKWYHEACVGKIEDRWTCPACGQNVV
jgi:hypothetical protein